MPDGFTEVDHLRLALEIANAEIKRLKEKPKPICYICSEGGHWINPNCHQAHAIEFSVVGGWRKPPPKEPAPEPTPTEHDLWVLEKIELACRCTFAAYANATPDMALNNLANRIARIVKEHRDDKAKG